MRSATEPAAAPEDPPARAHATAARPVAAERLARVVLPLAAAAALLPRVSGAVALVGGAALALTLGNPYAARTRRWTHGLLAASVAGLGGTMDLAVVARAGLHGLGYTLVGIVATLALGLALARLLRVERDTGLLVSAGTAICGGSAIAAVAPVVGARDHEVSAALATVFLLNAVALVLFPWVGHRAGLSQEAFGLWSALAVHDTSSVVGAALAYGPRAVAVATTVKLARALWIVPVTLVVGAVRGRGAQRGARPWFILAFLLVAAAVTWVPALRPAGALVARASHRALVLTLFLTGCGLTRDALRRVGARPFVQGLVLWAVMASVTLAAILAGGIR